MPNDSDTEDKPKKSRGGGPLPQGPSIWMQLAIAAAIFLILSVGYSAVRSYLSQQDNTVPISQIADDITAGKISTITVNGDNVTTSYTDGSTKTSHKEAESSLTQTLANYDIPGDKLAAVKITVQNQSGLQFWALQLIPIIVPS